MRSLFVLRLKIQQIVLKRVSVVVALLAHRAGPVAQALVNLAQMNVREAVQTNAVVVEEVARRGVAVNAKGIVAVVVRLDVVIFLAIQAIRIILSNNIFCRL